MTLATTITKVNYTANGVLTNFSFAFKTLDDFHLIPYLDDVAQGAGFTVNLNADQDVSPGGSVDFDTAPDDQVIVTLSREVPLTQETDYTPYDSFPSETHENALDLLTMQTQQNDEAIARAIKAPASDDGTTDYTMPQYEADKAVKWDSVDKKLINSNYNPDEAQTDSAASAAAALASENNAATSETNAATSETNAAASATEAEATLANSINKPSRNCALNQEPVTQGESTATGFSAVLGTNDDGLPSADFIRFSKDRNNIASWVVSDSLRGDNYLQCDTTAAEIATIPALNSDDVSFGWDMTHSASGVTNRNKAWSAVYNANLGVSAVIYEGDGIDGHEIPHNLGVVPELSIFKDRDGAYNWYVGSSLFATDERLSLNSTAALTSATSMYQAPPSADVVTLATGNTVHNTAGNNIISYHFASVEGVSKVDTYRGTGATGNYVPCGFKPAFVKVKNLTTGATEWELVDSIRGLDKILRPSSSAAEITSASIEFVDDGFVVTGTGTSLNALNDEFVFLAFAETNIDATKAWTDYSYPTTADTLSIENNTVVSVANGFNASGQVDTQYEFTGGVTHALGAGYENLNLFVYTSKAGVIGTTEHRPLIGWNSRNDADKWGEESPLDASLRTTAKHFDYESETGVALASLEDAGYEAWHAFNKDSNDIVNIADAVWRATVITNSQLQLKQDEARILKSWRMRETGARTPKRFTIEGSNDGYTWTAIDSTYTSADYVGNGDGLWSDLQLTSANTTAYLYHRINITANNGDATFTSIGELEFNTILPADYYLVEDGKMYDSSDVAIERTYLAKVITNSDGEVISIDNFPVAKQNFGDVEIQNDLVVHGDIENRGIATAWVNFDGTQNPPLILASKNVKAVVDLGVGLFKVIFDIPMDNEGYVYDGSVEHTTLDGVSTGVKGYAGGRTRTSCRITTQYSSSSSHALADFMTSVVFFGGKEIK